ncbi:unnamed protein product [Mytilus coruscus]|uniref:Uncharacterized protein n=1 Tax=Mytilus coruscus TaxID=42192 RepID=A0A6J8CAJ7_MYTCO|nr:unnamed protein product [Mytilus coruscus]
MDKGFESLRIRKLTEKAAIEFEATNDDFVTSLHGKWTTINSLISSFSSAITTVEYIDNIEKDISKVYTELCSTSSSYMLFLTNTRTDGSIKYYHEHLDAMAKCKKTVDEAIKHINDARQRALEVASQRTKGSARHSQGSNASSALSRKRAKAEAAKAKLVFAEQEIILKKEQAALEEHEMTTKAASSRKMLELEADLKLLASRQDLAVAEAEAEVYESGSVMNGPSLRNLEKLNQLKLINPMERTNQYVKDQINFINADNQPLPKPAAPLNVNAQTFSPVVQDNNIQLSNPPFQNLRKLLLREIANGSYNWDDPLPIHLFAKWSDWKQSLISLEGLHIPRCYSPTSSCNAAEKELHIFSDASEQAIASVAYLRTKDMDNNYHVGFVLGKAKVAPTHGHTIPRLELCAAVLAVQVSEIILEELDIQVNQTRFYTDSQVVLGYIYNQGKRFYKYVKNRVERIRKSTQPNQWSHVRTNFNPADSATRTVCAETFHNSMWILGPPQLCDFETGDLDGRYPLLDPDNDSEIRQNANVKTLKSNIENHSEVFKISHRTERFSEWNSLVKSINRLKMLARKFHRNDNSDSNTASTTLMSEQMIILNVQKEAFLSEIDFLPALRPIKMLFEDLSYLIDYCWI